MRDSRNRKMELDVVIIIVVCLWVLAAWYFELPEGVIQLSVVAAVLIGGLSLIDWLKHLGGHYDSPVLREQAAAGFAVHELILLDENEKPIKAWGLTGKTAMVIGRRNRNEEVDVDLSDCEYSALINVQHAVLNYCLDTWYIEDLGSQNGIQIRKVEDGFCYQVVSNRPCKLSAGDVIYIAKTKLLFT